MTRRIKIIIIFTSFNIVSQNPQKFAFSGYFYTENFTSDERPLQKKMSTPPRRSLIWATPFYTHHAEDLWNISFRGSVNFKQISSFVTQRELIRLFEGDIKTDILNSMYCSISKEHFDTKTIFISYFYQKLQIT